MNNHYLKRIIIVIISIINVIIITNFNTNAFPIYAQQGYDNPREATGRIVCANCHLAQKPIEIEVPKSILPNTVFEIKVNVPYESGIKQISGNGKQVGINTGAVVILPEGFKLAPKKLLSSELKTKTKNMYAQPYSKSQQNILVVGPVTGAKNQEIIFPVLSPDPNQSKNVHFFKYPIYIGANRGRGQIYPTGEKSNNNSVSATYDGKIMKINKLSETEDYSIEILKNNGETYTEKIPKGLQIKVKEGNTIKANESLTNDPNVGGFGQDETEIVLQSPNRIRGMIIFFTTTTLAQIFFVLKKKQWEKVQSSEINF